MSGTQPLPTLDTREIGVECSCGFKRRATKIADDGEYWNGREIESLHWFQISQEARACVKAGKPIVTHKMSAGLIATMEWPALTGEEHKIGEAWMDGNAAGSKSTRAWIKKRLDNVTVTEFGE